MTVTVATVAADAPATLAAFRSSAVTSENKGNTAARSLLAALLSNVWTQSLAESAIINAFGNPKSPKTNKPVAKLRGLDAFTGGAGVRRMAEIVFRIFSNVDIDAPVTDTETNVTVGAGAIRPLIVSFVLSADGAPKSLAALDIAVTAALKAHAKAIMPDNSDAAAETAAETADAAPAAPVETVSLIDRINALSVALSAASDDEFTAAFDAFNAMVAVSDARLTAMTDAAPVAANG